jgi:uncharacterized protein
VTLLDSAMAGLVVMAFLLWGLYIVSCLKSVSAEGLPALRNRAYRGTMALQWSLVAAVCIFWDVQKRQWSDLGLIPRFSVRFWIFAAILGVSLYPLGRLRSRLLAKPETLDKLQHISEGKGPGRLFPKSNAELVRFYCMSVSSSVTEELLFRGFLIWYFHNWFALWVSALFSALAFGLGHLYQGWNGAMQAGILGGIFGCLYLWTGSLLAPILVHLLINLHQAHAVGLSLRHSLQGHAATNADQGG